MVDDGDPRRRAWQAAVAAYRRGDHAGAERALAPLKRLPSLPPEVEQLAGIVALQNGRSEEAVQRLERAAAAIDGDRDLWLALGDARSALGRLDPAAEAYERSLACDPAHVPALRNLGLVHQRTGRDAEALACFDRLLERLPGDAAIARTRARLLTRMGRKDAALGAYAALVEAQPGDVELRIEHAEVLEQANRPDDARRALPGDDGLDDEQAARVLAVRARLLARAGETGEALQVLARAGDGPAWDWLGYQRGALLDGLGRPDEAMAAFERANRARAREPRFREARAVPFLDDLRSRIERGVAPAAGAAEGPVPGRDEPVFLVGLPRSGTTLLGRMLSAHPRLRLLDETETLRAAEAALQDGQSVEAARARYRRHAAGGAPGDADARWLDKNPLHIPQLDVVARVFPRAPVIVLLRHPFDAALSCYMQDFAPNPATARFLDLESTAACCAGLLDMIRVFERARPRQVVRVHYETLVRDFPGQIARVLRAIGLDHDPAVRDYLERTGDERLVRTPSHARVERPLDEQAVGRWSAYRDWLAAFREHLGPRLAGLGYAADRSLPGEPDAS